VSGPQVGPMSPWRRAVYRVLRAVLEAWCRTFWRMEVRGRERLPVTGPFILAPVHRSNIDFAIAGASVPRVVRFMAKNSLWKVAWAGAFLEAMGAFPVDRETADRAALRNCEQALAAGDPVVMFPEGRRRSGDIVEEVQDGPAWVACRNRVPVVPVGFAGTDKAMPIGSKLLYPAKVTVLIGEPIHPDVPLTGRVPRRVISEFSERIRKEVQALYDEVRAS
jgi:1-acyl-sn-glycerol-3-phosphate acyltransferase